MGKAFRRLEKQVNDRVRQPGRSWVPTEVRLRNTEVFLLELGSYIQKHVATNPEDESDSSFLAAYTDYKVALEGTIK